MTVKQPLADTSFSNVSPDVLEWVHGKRCSHEMHGGEAVPAGSSQSPTRAMQFMQKIVSHPPRAAIDSSHICRTLLLVVPEVIDLFFGISFVY